MAGGGNQLGGKQIDGRGADRPPGLLLLLLLLQAKPAFDSTSGRRQVAASLYLVFHIILSGKYKNTQIHKQKYK